jgi:hypothetical protein
LDNFCLHLTAGYGADAICHQIHNTVVPELDYLLRYSSSYVREYEKRETCSVQGLVMDTFNYQTLSITTFFEDKGRADHDVTVRAPVATYKHVKHYQKLEYDHSKLNKKNLQI